MPNPPPILPYSHPPSARLPRIYLVPAIANLTLATAWLALSLYEHALHPIALFRQETYQDPLLFLWVYGATGIEQTVTLLTPPTILLLTLGLLRPPRPI